MKHPAPMFYPAIDGLRALAVASVVVFHLRHHYLPGGHIGVDLFFAISGFLITGLLVGEVERTGRLRLGAFYLRRLIRLMPALVVLLLVLALWGKTTILQTCAALFYFANWVQALGGELGPLLHTWSLSVEEQFYLLWPLILLAAARVGAGSHRTTRAAVGGAALIGASVSLAASATQPEGPRVDYGTDTRMLCLFAGAALATALPRPAAGSRATGVTVVGVIALAGYSALALVPTTGLLRNVMTALVCVMLVACAARGAGPLLGRVLRWRAVRWIGRLSYGLYLWHLPFYFLLPLGMSPLVRTAEILAATFVAACASYYLVERPVQRRLRPLVS